MKIDMRPSWGDVLCAIVPMLLSNGTKQGRDDAMAILKDAADKLDYCLRVQERMRQEAADKEDQGE